MNQKMERLELATKEPIYALVISWVLLFPLLVFASGYGFSFELGTLNTGAGGAFAMQGFSGAVWEKSCASDPIDLSLYDLHVSYGPVCSNHRGRLPARHIDFKPDVFGYCVVYLVAECRQDSGVLNSPNCRYGIRILPCGTFHSK